MDSIRSDVAGETDPQAVPVIEAGQIWRFAPNCEMRGDCEIIEVNGYGQITGRFYDSIGTERTGPVSKDDLDYLVANEGRLEGDPEYENDSFGDD